MAGGGTRLHASFGMGLRPPSGFELAFTNNPALKPERTRSVDAGVEQKFGNLLTAGCHILLQSLLRSDRDAGRLADLVEPLQIGQPGEFAGAGRGVLGAPAAGALGAGHADPTRCSKPAFSRWTARAIRRRCLSRWGSS